MVTDSSLPLDERLRQVRERIRRACLAAGRPADAVRLLAVSKTRPPEDLRALAALGVHDVGENYLQEALTKQAALADLPLRWHFIGPIQANKTRDLATRFHWVHSVDRERVARRLNGQRPDHLPPLSVCLQVNVDGEDTKHGVAPEQVRPLAALVADLPRLRLRGLMCIPAPSEDPTRQRRSFDILAGLVADLRADGLPLDTLSMGMSGDLEAAVASGSTLVRVGTALFGPRPVRGTP